MLAVSHFIRAGFKLNVNALRAIHYSLSCIALSNATVIFSKEKLEIMLNDVSKFHTIEKLEGHLSLVAASALEENGTMKRLLVHNEFAFFTAITNILIAISKNCKCFHTFQSFKAECSMIRFSNTKRIDCKFVAKGNSPPFTSPQNVNQYTPKTCPRAVTAVTTKSRSKSIETDDNDESDYEDVAEGREGHEFAVVDWSVDIKPQPYYRWPALIEKGSGVVDDPLTWVHWGDMMIEIDVPPVSPSLVSSPPFSLHCDSGTSLDATSGTVCNGTFSVSALGF